MEKHVMTMPLQEEELRKLKIGDVVYLTGHIFTSRDMGHLRLRSLVAVRGHPFVDHLHAHLVRVQVVPEIVLPAGINLGEDVGLDRGVSSPGEGAGNQLSLLAAVLRIRPFRAALLCRIPGCIRLGRTGSLCRLTGFICPPASAAACEQPRRHDDSGQCRAACLE